MINDNRTVVHTPMTNDRIFGTCRISDDPQAHFCLPPPYSEHMGSENGGGRVSAVDLSAYKQVGFYQLLDPGGAQVCGRHAYKTALRAYLLVVQLSIAFGSIGFFVNVEHPDRAHRRSDTFELIAILANCILSTFKLNALITHADVIWDLFQTTSAEFLRCARRNRGTLAQVWSVRGK